MAKLLDVAARFDRIAIPHVDEVTLHKAANQAGYIPTFTWPKDDPWAHDDEFSGIVARQPGQMDFFRG